MEPLAPTSSAEVIIEPVAVHQEVAEQAPAFNLQASYGIDGIDGN